MRLLILVADVIVLLVVDKLDVRKVEFDTDGDARGTRLLPPVSPEFMTVSCDTCKLRLTF